MLQILVFVLVSQIAFSTAQNHRGVPRNSPVSSLRFFNSEQIRRLSDFNRRRSSSIEADYKETFESVPVGRSGSNNNFDDIDHRYPNLRQSTLRRRPQLNDRRESDDSNLKRSSLNSRSNDEHHHHHSDNRRRRKRKHYKTKHNVSPRGSSEDVYKPEPTNVNPSVDNLASPIITRSRPKDDSFEFEPYIIKYPSKDISDASIFFVTENKELNDLNVARLFKKPDSSFAGNDFPSLNTLRDNNRSKSHLRNRLISDEFASRKNNNNGFDESDVNLYTVLRVSNLEDFESSQHGSRHEKQHDDRRNNPNILTLALPSDRQISLSKHEASELSALLAKTFDASKLIPVLMSVTGSSDDKNSRRHNFDPTNYVLLNDDLSVLGVGNLDNFIAELPLQKYHEPSNDGPLRNLNIHDYDDSDDDDDEPFKLLYSDDSASNLVPYHEFPDDELLETIEEQDYNKKDIYDFGFDPLVNNEEEDYIGLDYDDYVPSYTSTEISSSQNNLNIGRLGPDGNKSKEQNNTENFSQSNHTKSVNNGSSSFSKISSLLLHLQLNHAKIDDFLNETDNIKNQASTSKRNSSTIAQDNKLSQNNKSSNFSENSNFLSHLKMDINNRSKESNNESTSIIPDDELSERVQLTTANISTRFLPSLSDIFSPESKKENDSEDTLDILNLVLPGKKKKNFIISTLTSFLSKLNIANRIKDDADPVTDAHGGDDKPFHMLSINDYMSQLETNSRTKGNVQSSSDTEPKLLKNQQSSANNKSSARSIHDYLEQLQFDSAELDNVDNNYDILYVDFPYKPKPNADANDNCTTPTPSDQKLEKSGEQDVNNNDTSDELHLQFPWNDQPSPDNDKKANQSLSIEKDKDSKTSSKYKDSIKEAARSSPDPLYEHPFLRNKRRNLNNFRRAFNGKNTSKVRQPRRYQYDDDEVDNSEDMDEEYSSFISFPLDRRPYSNRRRINIKEETSTTRPNPGTASRTTNGKNYISRSTFNDTVIFPEDV